MGGGGVGGGGLIIGGPRQEDAHSMLSSVEVTAARTKNCVVFDLNQILQALYVNRLPHTHRVGLQPTSDICETDTKARKLLSIDGSGYCRHTCTYIQHACQTDKQTHVLCVCMMNRHTIYNSHTHTYRNVYIHKYYDDKEYIHHPHKDSCTFIVQMK